MIEQFPELADQGFWYVVPTVTVEAVFPFDDEQITVDVPGDGWCAWHDGDEAVIRTPSPLAGVTPADRSVSQGLDDAWGDESKPYGRVGGR